MSTEHNPQSELHLPESDEEPQTISSLRYREELEITIGKAVDEIDPERVIPDNSRAFLRRALADLNVKLVRKFLKGQLEHGGDFMSIDHSREMHSEVLDLIIYKAADDYNRVHGI